MPVKYFSSAWQDIKNSPGWFGKLMILALVSLIPVFGWIVVCGYLFGWARDKAWGVHAPLPARVFGDEDGKLYSRGFFVLVIGFAFALLPWIIESVSNTMTGSFFGSAMGYHGYGIGSGLNAGIFGLLGTLLSVLALAASFFAAIFSWVGCMRMSIYGRLSAGFQFGKIWSMIRHDFGDLLRIVGMYLILFAVGGIVFFASIFILTLICMMVGMVATGGNLNINASHFDASIIGMILSVGGVAVLLSFVMGYVILVFAVFAIAMVARAMGYWTQQFNVPAWRGQDDPMPFEMRPPNMPYQQPPMQ